MTSSVKSHLTVVKGCNEEWSLSVNRVKHYSTGDTVRYSHLIDYKRCHCCPRTPYTEPDSHIKWSYNSKNRFFFIIFKLLIFWIWLYFYYWSLFVCTYVKRALVAVHVMFVSMVYFYFWSCGAVQLFFSHFG